jgi:hypothetical protein
MHQIFAHAHSGHSRLPHQPSLPSSRVILHRQAVSLSGIAPRSKIADRTPLNPRMKFFLLPTNPFPSQKQQRSVSSDNVRSQIPPPKSLAHYKMKIPIQTSLIKPLLTPMSRVRQRRGPDKISLEFNYLPRASPRWHWHRQSEHVSI